MDLSRTAAIASFVLSIPQGLAASFQVIDRINAEKLKVHATSKRRTSILTALLFLGMTACIVFGCWILFADPFHPVTIKETVTVEKPTPCPTPPPIKSGSATTRGTQSPAMSGSGNFVTYGQPAQPQTPPKK